MFYNYGVFGNDRQFYDPWVNETHDELGDEGCLAYIYDDVDSTEWDGWASVEAKMLRKDRAFARYSDPKDILQDYVS